MSRFKKNLTLFITTLGLLFFNASGEQKTTKNQHPVLPKEFRGVWIASVSNLHWPSKPGLSTHAQQKELTDLFDKIAALNLNVVMLQIRPACDALYHSTLEPWSEVLTGTMGKSPDPYYDPLEFSITQAHKRGLELHAWVNPLRARVNYKKAKSPVDSLHISQKIPECIIAYGKNLILDPGNPKTQHHVLAVIKDIVTRYNIDGLHIDDYFYPYPEKENNQNLVIDDSKSYKQYGHKLPLKEWRRNNINTFVKTMYTMVKTLKPHIKVSISPFGIWRPGVPTGIKAGIDCYNDLCADTKKWLNEGWCDYFIPQLYWRIGSPQDYKTLLDWWISQNKKNKYIVPGNYLYFNPQEIIDQINLTRATPGTFGNCLYSIEPLIKNKNNLYN
ncbi:hypothetical protein EBU24_02885, partial [bacterium]|nr:hypothetical protein [bacterium]